MMPRYNRRPKRSLNRRTMARKRRSVSAPRRSNRRMAAGESARLQQLKASGEFQTGMLQRKGEMFVRAQEQRRTEKRKADKF